MGAFVRDSVRAYFRTFTERFEGSLPFMYLDVLGLVTTGIGNLIDPVSLALVLPWTHKADGSPATRDQVVQEWMRVKALQAWRGYGGKYYGDGAYLELTPGGVTCLVLDKLAQNEVILQRRFPDWEAWPADAQLGTLSIAWAAGPAWVAPHFDGFARNLDFQPIAGKPGDAAQDPSCRGEAWLKDDGNPGLRPRNLANRILFQNAAIQVQWSHPFDALSYPSELVVS
jgi:hypothetical protein